MGHSTERPPSSPYQASPDSRPSNQVSRQPAITASQLKMNASEEDGDSKLQKVSTDVIRDVDAALQKYIRKPDGRGGTRVRSWARSSVIFTATCEVNTSFTTFKERNKVANQVKKGPRYVSGAAAAS